MFNPDKLANIFHVSGTVRTVSKPHTFAKSKKKRQLVHIADPKDPNRAMEVCVWGDLIGTLKKGDELFDRPCRIGEGKDGRYYLNLMHE